MAPTKQNLFLFFEENEVQTTIDTKLVLLYTNRCIIDEEAEFEICDIYQLQKVERYMYQRSKPLYKMYVQQRILKEANDRDTFSEALEKAYSFESNTTDTHFIVGSSFHSLNNSNRPKVTHRPRKLIKWMADEMKTQELSSVHITLLAGNRYSLITNESNLQSYNGKKAMKIATPGGQETPVIIYPKFSVNDDFELSIALLRLGRRLQQCAHLFLHPMLTPHQLHLMKSKDESYLRSFESTLVGVNPDVSEEELKFYPDNDNKLRYIDCMCIRKSFHIE